jgi:hypothetical protein
MEQMASTEQQAHKVPQAQMEQMALMAQRVLKV